MSTKSMDEILSDLEAIQEQLKKLGITPSQAEQLQDLMNAYIGAKEEVIKNRDSQFSENAYQVLAELKAISNKNTEMLSRFLRRFAVHIVKQVLQLDKTISEPSDMVDRIPPINEEDY